MSPIVGLLLLLVAQLGYLGWFGMRQAIGPALAPAGAVAAQMLLALAAGIAGQLRWAPHLVVGVGLLLLVAALRDYRNLGRTLLDPAILLLTGLVATLVVLLRGARLVHYDNFSHWALVVRMMLEDHAFPGAGDTLSKFHSYPLGTASWEYVVARLTGPDDWHLMMAQGYVLAACAVAVMAVTAGAARLAGAAGAVVVALALGAHGPPLTSLLVDSVLAGFTIAGLAAVAARRTDVLRLAPLLALLAGALAAVKQPGVVWAVVIVGAALVLGSGRVLHRVLAAIVVTLGAAAVTGLWTLHTAATFKGSGGKHSVSPNRFEQVLGDKSPQVRAQVSRLYAEATLADWRTFALLGVIAVLLVLLAHGDHLRYDRAAHALALAIGLVALVVVGQYVMYMVSMPTPEALHLAGFKRYVSTLHQVLAGAAVLAACLLARRARPVPVVLAVAAGVVIAFMMTPGKVIPPPVSTNSVPARVEAALGAAKVPEGARVCIYSDVRDGGYRAQIVRYLLLSPGVQARRAPERLSEPLPASCEYAFVLDPYPRARAYLREQGYQAPAGIAPIVVHQPGVS